MTHLDDFDIDTGSGYGYGRSGSIVENMKKIAGGAKDYASGILPIGIRTKLMYCSFLVVGFILALCFRNGFFGLFDAIWSYGWVYFCQNYKQKMLCSCDGGFVVSRISFSCVAFFSLNCILSSRIFCVTTKVRLFIQNNWCFWVLRFFLFLFFILIPFVIPDQFFYVFGWISIFISGLFILCQLIIIIDYAYSWQEGWINTETEGGGRTIWQYLLLLFGTGFFCLGLVFFILELVLFGIGGPCHVNRIVIICTLVIGLIAICFTIIRGYGVLPGTIIYCYAQFTVWMAIMSNPDTDCNTIHGWISKGSSNNASQIITIIFSVSLAVFSIMRTTVSTSLLDFCACGYREDSVDNPLKHSDDESDDEGLEKLSRENDAVFADLVVLTLSSFYFGTVLNNWEVNDYITGNPYSYGVSVTSFAVKSGSILMVYCLYFFTLVAKWVFCCRDFGEKELSFTD